MNGNAEGSLGQPVPGLACITAGSRSKGPVELFESPRCAEFLDTASKAYDMVVLDTGPLLLIADTLELLPQVDAVLLCVRSSQTTRDQARSAVAAIEHYPPRPVGMVVTGLTRRDEAESGYDAYAYAATHS
jgi:Mrp family chromosome partitioning ATPase